MITRTYSTITKDISRSQLWELMADVAHWHEWDAGIEYTKYEGAFAAGTSFTLKPVGGPAVSVTLLQVTPKTYFKDVTRFPLAEMFDEHWYEETPEGLKITSTLTMTGPLAFVWNRIVMKKMADKIPDNIASQIAAARTRLA